MNRVLTIIILVLIIMAGGAFSASAQPSAITCVVEELRPISYILFAPGIGYIAGEPGEGDNPEVYVDSIIAYWAWPGEIPEDPDVFPELRYAVIRDGAVVVDVNSDLVSATFYYKP